MDITFETILRIVTVYYTVPVLLLLLASGVGLAVIETLEEVGEL